MNPVREQYHHSVRVERTLTRHVVQQLVLVAEHDGWADNRRTGEGFLDELLALRLRAVERRRRVVGSVQVRDVHEAVDTVLRSDARNKLGAPRVNVVISEVPVPMSAWLRWSFEVEIGRDG